MKQPIRLRATAGAVTAVLVALLGLLLASPRAKFGNSLVEASYDTLHRLTPVPPMANSEVVIVYLDLDSYLSTKQDPSQPWSRALHAQLVRRLSAAGARTIVFDVVFSGASTNPQDDEAFASAMRESGRVVLAAELNASGQHTGNAGAKTLLLRPPDEPFASAAASWGLASLHIDDDFVVRRYFGGFEGQPSLTTATAKLLRLSDQKNEARWLRYYGPPLTIPHVSYSAALKVGDVPDEMFRDKVVFIGARPFVEGFRERHDELRTPFRSWRNNQLFMPAVEIHATEMLNLVRGEWLRRTSAATEIGLLVAVACLFGIGLMWLRPLPASAVAVLSAGGALLLAQYIFTRGVWFPWLIVAAIQLPTALVSSILVHSVEWYRTRRRMEAAKRIADAKIREQASLIDKAHDAILVQDLGGRVFYANPSAEKLYGWSLAELQRDGIAKNLFPDPAKWNEARTVVTQAGDWSSELRQQTRSGTTLIVEARWTLIRDDKDQPTALLMIHSDISEKKQLEAQLLRTQRMETIGSLAGGMAHDLNNALSPVLLGAQLLKRKAADEESSRILSLMEMSTQRGADMVRQVLLFARGKEGDFERVNVGAVLKDITKMARETFPKNVTIESFVAGDLHPVRGNVTQLHQVLLNLCVNARDAMPDGGRISLVADNADLSVADTANLPGAKPGEFVSISVGDTGVGIPPEIRARIFEAFFTTKAEGKGTGLGLATVQRIVKNHDGFLRVESEPGQGTTFEVLLPRAPDSETKMKITIAEAPRGHGELVLAIDDERAIRDLLAEGLAANGYRVLTASNGVEALQLFQQRARDVKLVITDSAMPMMDGSRVIDELRKLRATLPVVIASAEVETSEVDGITARLRKPFALEDMLTLVARLIAKSGEG